MTISSWLTDLVVGRVSWVVRGSPVFSGCPCLPFPQDQCHTGQCLQNFGFQVWFLSSCLYFCLLQGFLPLKIPIPMPPPCGSHCLLLASWTALCLWPEPVHLDCLSHSRSITTHTYNASGQSRQGESEEGNPAASPGSEMCKSAVAPPPVDSARKGVWSGWSGVPASCKQLLKSASSR